MGLEHLSIVQQSAQFGCCRREVFGIEAHDLVDGFGSGQVVADRTNATKSLYQHGCFPIGMPLNEAFETPELNDVEKTVFDAAVFVHMNRYPAMSFHSGYRINNYFF
jgi:hypothetical protein